MLDANDLKLIGEEMGRVIDDNLMPRLEEFFDQKFDEKFEAKFGPIRAVMVTKDYLDEKMADLKGELIAQDRKLEKKTDALIGVLAEKRMLNQMDIERLERSRIFPS